MSGSLAAPLRESGQGLHIPSSEAQRHDQQQQQQQAQLLSARRAELEDGEPSLPPFTRASLPTRASSSASYGVSPLAELLATSAPASFDDQVSSEAGPAGLPYASRQTSALQLHGTVGGSAAGLMQSLRSAALADLEALEADLPASSVVQLAEAGGGPPLAPHGTEEERPVCAFYKRTGTCAYGDRCKFVHPSDCPPPKLNQRGYPVRPEEPDCPHYVKKGWCAFGATCKFHHQDNDASIAQLLAGAGPPGMPGGYALSGLHGRMAPTGPAVHPYLALPGQQQLQGRAAAGLYQFAPGGGMASNALYYLSQAGSISNSGANAMGGMPMVPDPRNLHAAAQLQGTGGAAGGLPMGIQQRSAAYMPVVGDYSDFQAAAGAGGYQQGAAGVGAFAMHAPAYHQMGLPMAGAGGGQGAGGGPGAFLHGQASAGGAMGMGAAFLPTGAAGASGRVAGLDGGMGGYMGGTHLARGGYPGQGSQHGQRQSMQQAQRMHMQHQKQEHGHQDDALSGFDDHMMQHMGMPSLGEMPGMGRGHGGAGGGGMYETDSGAGGNGSVQLPDTMVSSQLASAMQRLRMREGGK